MVVTKLIMPRPSAVVLTALIMLLNSITAVAATLAPDSVDMLYHRYEGGGMTIDGPSVLVRKGIGSQVSLTGHYYVDTVSAASVDVLATASKYTEERTEYSGGIDVLHNKAVISAGYTNSSENDYEANTLYLSAKQDFFGDMTTLSMAYAKGWDEVGMRGQDRSQWQDLDRDSYKLGLTQILTKSSLLGLNLDVISDDGKLENPYRVNYYLNQAGNREAQAERYPDTRNSLALGMHALYYLPYRASIKAGYRYFSDSWEIRAHTFDLAYSHAFGERWIVEAKLRHYRQHEAEFYSDLFAFENSQTHLARDKELSRYHGNTFGVAASYEIKQGVIPFVKRMQVSLIADYLRYDYDNFRDVTAQGFAAGQEPLYHFDAWVTRSSLIIEF